MVVIILSKFNNVQFAGLPDPSQLFSNLPVDVMGIVRRTRGPRAVRYIKDENGVKYYMCEYCEYKCRSPGNLAKHVRRHTGEKPYLCPYCDYKAADRGSIKSHVRRHTGERPFQCSYCEYRSPYTSTLRAHMRKHTGEKPFFCTKCEYRYDKYLINHHTIYVLIQPKSRAPKFSISCELENS